MKKCFQWKVYLRYWNKMDSTSQKISFHRPKLKTTFPLDEKKTGANVCYMHKSLAEMSEKQMKKVFPLARNSLSTSRNAFKNTFPLDGKIKLAVAGVCLKMKEKKWFPLARKSVSTSRNKVIFQKLDLPVSTNRTKISR